MSSWFPSSFSSDDNPSPESSSPTTPSVGFKENVSNLFCGVAAFLPQPPPNSDVIAGMKNDFVEIKDTLKSCLSFFSSKLTSLFLQFPRATNDSDDGLENGVVGVTEDVVDFVGKISSSPELWTDFPISLRDDVDMSDYQREHASEIERLVVETRATILQMFQNKITFGNSDSSEEDGGEEVEESTIEHNVIDEALNATKVVTKVDYDHMSLSRTKKVLSTADAKEWVEVNESCKSQIRDKGLESEELDDWVTIYDSDRDNWIAI
ncbi:unnamed protein product [Fraxinus pennsylvanica]|uniref:Uncharacterized protein n=1 Tax=Fraxinus pennsylvanica TaxID=56036 RepID=A0AAD1Z237_9LAMI|nr:unnamed protein product [Fraxinus pennsylvanica]